MHFNISKVSYIRQLGPHLNKRVWFQRNDCRRRHESGLTIFSWGILYVTFRIWPNFDIFQFSKMVKFSTLSSIFREHVILVSSYFVKWSRKHTNKTEYSLSFHLCVILLLVNANVWNQLTSYNGVSYTWGWVVSNWLFNSSYDSKQALISTIGPWFMLVLIDIKKQCESIIKWNHK